MSDSADTDAAAAASRTASDYDAVPYLSVPHKELHPGRLGAIARLFGLRPAPVSTARVLDIGCASGGHLIPLAAAFPEARFLGVDISPVQIADGRARSEKVGLRNLELSAVSFTDLGTDNQFDYIICHGVYSWISEALRETLMRVCAECLAPNGVAVVSYNTLPGGRMLQMIRDCVLLHARGQSTHSQRIAATRQLFKLMSEQTDASKNYGSTWREFAQILSQLPDAYLAHELFEENNTPVTFADFMGMAGSHGLAYLADAELAANLPENAGGKRGELIRELAGNRLHDNEQYFDLLTGRTFRSSLLVRAEDKVDGDRSLPLDRFDDLHFIAPRKFNLSPGPQVGTWTASDGGAGQLIVNDGAVAEALVMLKARLPSSSTLSDLLDGSEANGATALAVRKVLRRLACRGMIALSTEAVVCASAIAERPVAWPLAACDASAGRELTATLRHARFEITPPARLLLPLLDGTRDRAALTDALLQVALSGGASVSEGGKPVTDTAKIVEFCRSTVDQELRIYADVGLLLNP